MRIETVTYHVYKYNELSEDAKQKAKDDYLSDDHRPYLFNRDLEWYLEDLFGTGNDMNLGCKFGGSNSMKVQFSLGYCQGDVMNIYGNVYEEDIFKALAKSDNYPILEEYADVMTDAEKDTILYYAGICNDIELPRNDRYCYCMADYIDFADDWRDSLEWEDYENIDVVTIHKFENLVQDIFSALCRQFEEWGYKYFYEISDEEMEEMCEANELEFYENGKLFC